MRSIVYPRAHPLAFLAAWGSLPTLLALAETHLPKETAGGATDARLGRRGGALKGPGRGQKRAADNARRRIWGASWETQVILSYAHRLACKHSTCGLVATTSAAHAGGRQIDPVQVYVGHLRRNFPWVHGPGRTQACSLLRPAVRHSLVVVAELSKKTLRAFHRAPTRANSFAFLAAWGSLPTLLALAETHLPKETAGGATDARLGRRGGALKGPGRGQKRAADNARRRIWGASWETQVILSYAHRLACKHSTCGLVATTSAAHAGGSPDRSCPGLCGACAAGG